MIAPYVRRPAPAGYFRLSAGEVTTAGDVAPADRRSLECLACGRLVLDNPGGRAAHRRSHARTEAA